jgi:hypothetical protein
VDRELPDHTVRRACSGPNECFCADGPDLANGQLQDACFGELLAYQLNVGQSFLVSGSQSGIPQTRQAAKGAEPRACEDIPNLDVRTRMRIPLNAPRCGNIPNNALDSRCNPDDPERCPSTAPSPPGESPATANANLLRIIATTTGDPNPCLFNGGPNETDPLSSAPSHIHALFRNEQVQFMMTNLEQPISGTSQIRFDVHGGNRPQVVYTPPTVEITMPTRIVVGPFDAQVPSETAPDAPDVPYLFVVDQLRISRTGRTRGQLLRIQPRGQAVTVPSVGSQPWYEDFSHSGELFPIQ